MDNIIDKKVVAKVMVDLDKVLQNYLVTDYNEYLGYIEVDDPDGTNYDKLVTDISNIKNNELIVDRIEKNEDWNTVTISFTGVHDDLSFCYSWDEIVAMAGEV